MSFILIFIALILGRANSSLLGYEFLNTDEFVIGAKALRLIKNNFNLYEFDGDTSGLLNAIFLTWPNIFNIDITYLSIRLSAIFSVTIILFFTYKLILQNLGKKLSFIIFIPLLLFFSFTKDPDFLHYTNELITTLLIMLSFYLIFDEKKIILSKKAFFISLILGSVLFAKMQFFPVAAIIVLILILRQFFVIKDFKNSIVLCVGFLSPTIFLTLYYSFNNNLVDFFYNVIHYPLSDLIARNVETEKVLADTNNLIAVSKSNKFKTLVDHLLLNSVFHLTYFYFFIFLIFATRIKKLNLARKGINFNLILITLSIILTLIILIGTGSVHRHYLVVLLPMIPVFISIFIKNYQLENYFLKKGKTYIFIFLALFISSLFFENYKFYSKKFTHVNFLDNKINFYSPNILSYLSLNKEESIVVWGWKPEIYLLSNLSPASRDTVNQKQIDFKSNREYFKQRFIEDFKKNSPALVTDYVKPKGYMFKAKEHGVKNFPELKNLFTKKYKKISYTNSNCPDLYLKNKNAKKFFKNNLNFSFEKNKFKYTKMNDFNIDEEICDTSVIFSKNFPNKIKLKTELNEINNIMILASKKNKSEAVINLEINYNNQFLENEKIILNKYPFWTKLIFKNKYNISDISLDISDLKNKKYGISEIKIYKD